MLTWSRLLEWLARNGSRAAMGAALVSLPVLLAIHQLRVSAPTRREPSSVAVIPSPAPKPDAGVAVGVLAEAADCGSDVGVTVVAQPTAEYWVANRDASGVTFALPDARRGDVRFRLGQSASDVTSPQDVVGSSQDDAGAGAGKVRVVKTRYEGREHDLLVASLEVPRWKRTLAPVIASYSADWLEHRGLGSCWLRLPALTGDFTVLAAMRARDLAVPSGSDLQANRGDLEVSSRRVNAHALYTAGYEAVHGSITVVAPEGEIGESLPGPSGSTNGSPTWACRPQPKAKVRSLRFSPPSSRPLVISGTADGASPGAFSTKVIASAKAGNCSAVAALIESSAGWQRDLFMLVIGTLVGLGFTLLVDLLRRS